MIPGELRVGIFCEFAKHGSSSKKMMQILILSKFSYVLLRCA